MKLLTPAEVAEMLSVNVDTVKRYSRNGELVGLQLGGRWRYQLSDIEGFIARQKEKSKSAAQSIPFKTTKEVPAIDAEKEDDICPIIEPVDSFLVPELPPEPQQDPIEIIFKLKAEGIKYHIIADQLNNLGLKTKQGKEWTKDIVENNVRKHKKEMEDILQ